MQYTASLELKLNSHNDPQSFIKLPTREPKPNVKLIFSKKSDPPPDFLQEETQSHDSLLVDDYTRAQTCISLIDDPLWQNICMDLLSMMGPASVLKIWKSKLGEFSSQEKTLELTCGTGEMLKFAQQYDFVILGSLQRYFPALKQLRVKALSVELHQ